MKATIFSFGLLITSVLSSNSVYACACCAELEVWETHTRPINLFEREVIENLTFGDAMLTDISLSWEADQDIDIKNIEINKQRLVFSTALGQMTFSIAQHKTQIRNIDMGYLTTPPSQLTPIELYKEINFTGYIQFNKRLSQRLKSETGRGRFILQGNGNLCLEKETFKRWIFQIDLPDNTRLQASGRIN